jgi:spermidine/putrescine transport system ATP-binding protein
VPKAEIERRVTEALALVDLSGLGARKPAQFSGGQQQRVALARALINQPKVLLLDEPLGALDARLRKQMQLELKRIQMEVGITFIYVTHDQEEALTMSDRIGVMRSGRIEQVGAPQDVYDHPATEFVARFLGASNLLDGALEGQDGELVRIRTASGDLISAPAESLRPGLDRVKAGVRPEKISLREVGESAPQGWNSVIGRIQLATFVGVSYQYTIEGPAGTILTVFAQNAGTGWMPSPGDPVRLLWRPENTFVVQPSGVGMEDEV